MSYRVKIAPEADAELSEIERYLRDDCSEPELSVQIPLAFLTACETLSEMPFRYPVVESLRLLPREIRKMRHKNYVVLYNVNQDEETVEILHIASARQNWYTRYL